MDHGHMNHGDMDHGHMDHGGDGNMCQMNMVFTFSYNNLCIVFPQWRITSTPTLLISLLAIVAITAGYELLRETARRYDLAFVAGEARYVHNGTRSPRVEDHEEGYIPGDSTDEQGSSNLTWAGNKVAWAMENGDGRKTVRAAFYAAQVFYSFFVMLLFMTYNGWVMLAVAVGAFVGYMIWGSGSAAKSVACH